MTAKSIAVVNRQSINWIFPDIPSDIIVEVDGVTYALHKFPLISRCGLMRMLVVDEQEKASKVELEGVPGGAEGFELAAKFCYGGCLEISKYNIALLRCVAEYLDMSEEHGDGNLVSQTEAYLERLGKQTLKDIVATLMSCENLLPMAEELRIVSRCIEWAALKAVQEKESNQQCLITFHEYQHDSSKVHIDWWVEDLSVLRIDFYQRVLAAMRARGLKTEGIGGALVYYAHQSLKGLTKKNLGLWDPTISKIMKVHDATTAMEHEQRILVETIVSLLPREKQVVSINFLIGLLRTAYILETTLSCRLDLERRIGIQLHRATLDDLLIPSLRSYDGETLFDVDIVHRLFVSFLEQKDEDDLGVYDDNNGFSSPSQHPMLKVGKLLDAYLVEIASDTNLSLSKFVDLAELVPEYARTVEDGLYRAVDLFLKAHPSLTDVEKKKLCRLLDFQKLSQEACMHAAQNERLPVQAVVQVLYFEQLRIRNAIAGSSCHHTDISDAFINNTQNHNLSLSLTTNQNTDDTNASLKALCKFNGGAPVVCHKDHYASVRRENRELKLEVARMKMRLSDLEKGHQNMKQDMERTHFQNSHQHHQGFFHAFSKSISKLNPFHHHKLNPVSHHHQSLSQSEPQRRANSVSSGSSKASFEQHKKASRRKRYSVS